MNELEIEKMAEFLDANTEKTTGWALGDVTTNLDTCLRFYYSSKSKSVKAVIGINNEPIANFYCLATLEAFFNAVISK